MAAISRWVRGLPDVVAGDPQQVTGGVQPQPVAQALRQLVAHRVDPRAERLPAVESALAGPSQLRAGVDDALGRQRGDAGLCQPAAAIAEWGMPALVYREEQLHPVLSDWVSCAWTYEREYAPGEAESIVPDGMVELIVQLGAPYRDEDVELPRCVAIAPLDHPLVLHADEDVRLWSIRVPWWGLAPFGDVRAFAGRQWAPAAEVFDPQLVSEVGRAVTTSEPVESVNRVLLAHLLTWTARSDTLRDAGRAIATHVGAMSVDELASACATSARQLQRSFRSGLDATPTQMIARRRFEQARRMLMDRDLPLAFVATEAGYADQSHMNRAFAEFAGVTPLAYRKLFESAVDAGSDVALVQD